MEHWFSNVWSCWELIGLFTPIHRWINTPFKSHSLNHIDPVFIRYDPTQSGSFISSCTSTNLSWNQNWRERFVQRMRLWFGRNISYSNASRDNVATDGTESSSVFQCDRFAVSGVFAADKRWGRSRGSRQDSFSPRWGERVSVSLPTWWVFITFWFSEK